jgi:hypothetical protein
MHRDERVTDEMVEVALAAFQSGDMDWSSQDEELMRFALEEAFSTMPRPKPIAHLVWLQGRRSADDVEDYYEVARAGDKCADGSEPFPVYAALSSASEEVVETWRPIETAPLNEEVFLGWFDMDGDWVSEVGEGSWGWRNEKANNISSHGYATHWMLLPTPPALRSSGSAEVGSATESFVHVPGGMPAERKTEEALAHIIERAKEQIAAMTPAEREKMLASQRESFARGMSTPCEHGILDFEQCPECRAVASKSKGISE